MKSTGQVYDNAAESSTHPCSVRRTLSATCMHGRPTHNDNEHLWQAIVHAGVRPLTSGAFAKARKMLEQWNATLHAGVGPLFSDTGVHNCQPEVHCGPRRSCAHYAPWTATM